MLAFLDPGPGSDPTVMGGRNEAKKGNMTVTHFLDVPWVLFLFKTSEVSDISNGDS